MQIFSWDADSTYFCSLLLGSEFNDWTMVRIIKYYIIACLCIITIYNHRIPDYVQKEKRGTGWLVIMTIRMTEKAYGRISIYLYDDEYHDSKILLHNAHRKVKHIP